MTINNLAISWRFLVGALLSLSLTMLLTGCNSLVNIPAPDTMPIQSSNSNHVPNGKVFNQCPPFNSENTVCNAQYEPVCVKTQKGSIVSYRTASNACSACSTPEAVGYVKGECL